VKKHKPFIVSLLLLQVFLLASTNAFAFSNTFIDTDSGQGDYLNAHQNKKAVLFEESVSRFDAQVSSENENDHPSFNIEHSFNFRFRYSYSVNNPLSEFQPNGKELLKKNIFPFHFFW